MRKRKLLWLLIIPIGLMAIPLGGWYLLGLLWLLLGLGVVTLLAHLLKEK